MARKVASYKKIRPPRVKLGQNQDAGFAIRVAVTDTRADIYQPYQHPKADQKVTIGFLDHEEVASRRIWQQFIQQNAARVTEPDVDLVSVQSARHSASVYVSFVAHEKPAFQVLRVAQRLGGNWQKMPVLQTQFLEQASEVGDWVRKIVAGEAFQPFTFQMYTWLRWWSQPGLKQQLEKRGKHWLVSEGEHHDGLSDEHVAVAQTLLKSGLLAVRQTQVVVSDTGIALMNYFARYYETQFAQSYGETSVWQSDELLTEASADTLGQFTTKHTKRRQALKLPTKVPKNYRGDRWR
ncbi:hypothetical protein EFL45_06765 [Weissella confusa]|uniref:hypothetical protein n=1 Tax=Weissella confusa TaxID=1583 RepID=UPI00223B8C50|nr:hypothetical protein [Weissella confusa]MCT0949114.1 hypothetical protein [Weissella confusa]